jgi:hypothetical protein
MKSLALITLLVPLFVYAAPEVARKTNPEIHNYQAQNLRHVDAQVIMLKRREVHAHRQGLRLARMMSLQQRKQLDELRSLVRRAVHQPEFKEKLKSNWSNFVHGFAERSKQPVDVMALVQSVLRDAYREAANDLAAAADRVKRMNAMKRQIRQALRQSRKHRQLMAHRKRQQRPIPVYHPPRLHYMKTAGKIFKLETLDDLIRQYEDKLNSIGEDAQLANIDLQNALQKQQQIMQTLSGISKLLHDTAMAVVRKIG